MRLTESFWVQLTENIVCRAPQCWSGFPLEAVCPLVSQLHLIQTKFSFLSSLSLLFILWLSPKSSLIPHDLVSWCTDKRKRFYSFTCVELGRKRGALIRVLETKGSIDTSSRRNIGPGQGSLKSFVP